MDLDGMRTVLRRFEQLRRLELRRIKSTASWRSEPRPLARSSTIPAWSAERRCRGSVCPIEAHRVIIHAPTPLARQHRPCAAGAERDQPAPDLDPDNEDICVASSNFGALEDPPNQVTASWQSEPRWPARSSMFPAWSAGPTMWRLDVPVEAHRVITHDPTPPERQDRPAVLAAERD
jgi:hypothetical protein